MLTSQEDYEPMIDFFEIDNDFHQKNEEAKIILQRVLDGNHEYDGGTQPAEELWHCLIGNVLKNCRESIVTTWYQKSLDFRKKPGATTTSSSSVVAGSSSKYVPVMPTPTSTTQWQQSSPAMSRGASRSRPATIHVGRRLTASESLPEIVHSMHDHGNATNAQVEKSGVDSDFTSSRFPLQKTNQPGELGRTVSGQFSRNTFPHLTLGDDLTAGALQAGPGTVEEEEDDDDDNPFEWCNDDEEVMQLGANFDYPED